MQSSEFPDIASIVGEALQSVEPALQPLLLAALERFAAERYRIWASTHEDETERAGLLRCAEREEEIATRIESLYPDARAKQAELMADNPELGKLGKRLFADVPLRTQWEMQAEGERAGASAWQRFAAAAGNDKARDVIASCAPLETSNAEFLQSLLNATR